MADVEKSLDQELKFDQVPDADVKDVTFNMDNYGDMAYEIPENEKKEYEKLNIKFNDIRTKLATQIDKFIAEGIKDEVRKLLKSNKSSIAFAYEDIANNEFDDKIYYHRYNTRTNNYDVYYLKPYKKNGRPYLETSPISRFMEDPKKTQLTVQQYESMLTTLETVHELQENAYNEVKEQRNAKIDKIINPN